jgi:succinoglycan biosynthesis transport protein ExoP
VLQSDARIIQSEPVIRAALEATDGAAHPSARAMAQFAKALKVEVEPNSNIIRVSFHSRDRDRALRAAQAVVDGYVARRAGLYVNGARARQDQEIDRYASALRATEADIQTVRAAHAVLDVNTDIRLASDRLDALSQRAGQTRERLGVVRAELAATGRTLAATVDRVLDSQERTNSTPNDEARNTLLRLRQERAHVAGQYSDDWPGLIELDAKIAAARAQIVENAQDIRSSDRTVRNPVADMLAQRRAALGVERAALTRQSAELAVQVAAAQARVRDLGDAEMRLHDLERSRGASETIYRTLLVSRAGSSLEDQAVDDHNTTLRIVQPPTAPMAGRELRPALVLAGLFAGLAAAAVGVTLSTVLRQTFVTPEEAEGALGLPGLMTMEAEAADAGSPEGQTAVRRLASLLTGFSVDGRPARAIQIVGEGSGKSRLGLVLAQALATSGRREAVLLLDRDAADHYRRKAATTTLRRLPIGSGHLDVARSSLPGLWVATGEAGGPDLPGAVPTVTVAPEMLMEVLRGAFGRIVVVGRADVEAPDARRLHPLVDATVMLVAAERTRGPVASKMREAVLAAGGDLLGFVFTGRRKHIPEAIYRWL